jgi:hypothetical protein
MCTQDLDGDTNSIQLAHAVMENHSKMLNRMASKFFFENKISSINIDYLSKN